MILDALCVIVAGYFALHLQLWQFNSNWYMRDDVFLFSIAFIAILNNIIMDKAGLYGERNNIPVQKLAFLLIAVVVVDYVLLATSIFILKIEKYSRLYFLYFSIFTFLFLFFQRLCVSNFLKQKAKHNNNAKQILLLGDEKRGQTVINALEQQLCMGYRIIEKLDFMENDEEKSSKLDEIKTLLKEKQIDEVIFAIPRNRAIDLTSYVDICCQMGKPSRILPSMWEPTKPFINVEKIQNIPFLTVHVDNFSAGGYFYKCVFDFLGGFVGTIVFCLLYPFVALAIKIDSKGPVIFKQKRIGKHGRVFRLYKFRSMQVDAEKRKYQLMKKNEMQGPIFKIENDPRITRVGKFLRKTSIDEVPQFLNVLKGEMSLVGTRPPTLDEVKKYEIEHYKRIATKPGITGLWQISGRNNICKFDDVVKLDCQYIENWRLIDDFKILLKTIFVVFAKKGAS